MRPPEPEPLREDYLVAIPRATNVTITTPDGVTTNIQKHLRMNRNVADIDASCGRARTSS